tara:strand:+ start:154 stop:390 length:237 start_codon:yes stop_codon:yes gene_type:complete
MKTFVDFSHLKRNNESYFSHLAFALSVGVRLGTVASLFIVHSVLPWLIIPKSLNLEATGNKIQTWNQYVDSRKESKEK